MTTTNEIIYNHGRPIILLLLLLASPAAAQTGRDDRESPPPPPTYGFNARFNPSMAIIIAVLISAFFLMGFFSIYVRRCIGENGSVGGGAHAIAGRIRSRRGPRGLDAEVIETFPTFEYSVVKNLKLGNGTLECAVCLNEFENEETLRLLPKCNHVFHPECIDAWLATHTTCPVCRCNLVPDSDTAAAETREPDVVGSEIRPAEINNEHEVVITVDEALPPREPEPTLEVRPPNLINPISNPISNRPPRSKSSRWLGWPGKFPRSHSTGHSLVQPGENMDRFTLRLPEHIRGELVKGKLNRTTSCLLPADGTATDGSVRRGFRSGSQGSSRGRAYGRLDRGAKSERWVFSMAPPFISRSFSARSPSYRGGAVKMPFDCISGASAGGDSEESVIPPRSATPVFTVAQPP